MKSVDADLIDKLNSLPEEERDALLEFLGARGEASKQRTQDMLEASAWMHRNGRNGGNN